MLLLFVEAANWGSDGHFCTLKDVFCFLCKPAENLGFAQSALEQPDTCLKAMEMPFLI